MHLNFKLTLVSCSLLLVLGCKEQPKKQNESPIDRKKEYAINFQNKGHKLVYAMIQKVGGYNALKNKKDVVYTYTYTTPDGKTDISAEKYIFEGELSYGLYQQHQRTLPNLKGPIEQGYDGNTYWLKHNGKPSADTNVLKQVAFTRTTNFYWFAMFHKLLDPGLQYQYLGEKTIGNNTYDVVKVTFNTTDSKPTDTYQLYINKETDLVDQFLFTVADFGLIETPLLMQVEYEAVEDVLLPTKRKYKKSTWEATVNDAPWVNVTWSDIQFTNGLSTDDFKK